GHVRAQARPAIPLDEIGTFPIDGTYRIERLLEQGLVIHIQEPDLAVALDLEEWCRVPCAMQVDPLPAWLHEDPAIHVDHADLAARMRLAAGHDPHPSIRIATQRLDVVPFQRYHRSAIAIDDTGLARCFAV